MDDAQFSPEKHLWRSVLIVGMLEATSDRHSMDAQLARYDAEAWISSTSTDVYSFEWTCELLGLDPDATRRAILDMSFARRPGPRRLQTVSPTLRNVIGNIRKFRE